MLAAVLVPGACAGSRPATDASAPLLWGSSFEDGTLAAWEPLVAAPDRAVVYRAGALPGAPEPRNGARAVRLTTRNGDLRSPNDRTQLDGRVSVVAGDDVYFRFSVYFPADFPTDAGRYPGFFAFAELIGPPFDGSPASGTFTVVADGAGQRIAWSRGPEHGYDRPWSVPLVRGRWHDVVLHLRLATDPTAGFVELDYDGRAQSLAGDGRRLTMATLRANNTAGLFPVVTNYRAADSIAGPTVLFFDDVRLARSRAAVTR